MIDVSETSLEEIIKHSKRSDWKELRDKQAEDWWNMRKKNKRVARLFYKAKKQTEVQLFKRYDKVVLGGDVKHVVKIVDLSGKDE